MEEKKLADQDEIFDFCDRKHLQKKRNKNLKLVGRLRRAGFDTGDLNRDHLISVNAENFDRIREEQLQHRSVRSKSDPHFPELPLMNAFDEELSLNRAIWTQMDYFNLLNPFPVQQIVIPYITQTDRDLLVRAQAGSGKTFTFLLPIVDRIIQLKANEVDQTPNTRAPYAVIVSPTIELTMQIAKDAARILHGTVHNVKVMFSVGQQDNRDFEVARRQGCDILVTSPGKLWSFFLDTKKGTKQPFFSSENIKFVVLDEADRLMDDRDDRNKTDDDGPGSFRQIMKDFIVHELTNKKKKWDFRALFFCATMANEDAMRELLTDKFLEIHVGKSRPVSTVVQNFIKVKADFAKLDCLMDFLELYSNIVPAVDGPSRKIDKTIIFVNNKRLSDRLAHALLSAGYSAKSINSDRSSRQRYEAVQEMLNNEIDILVSSGGLVARGMNFPNVQYVINYDFPQEFNYQEYHHRISRVGRIGNVGKAITFFNPLVDNYAAPDLIKGCEENGQDIPQVLQDCADHYFYSNNNNIYSQSNYTQRRPSYDRPQRNRPASLSSTYSYVSSGSNSSSRQASPRM